MKKITTQSTSSKSAIASPIVVRETETVRLIFKPILVANENQPRACIKGEFIYQKKKSESEWEDANTESLATIKSGEQYKLSLHSAELLALMEALGPLYRAQWATGGVIQKGLREYVAIDRGLAEFLRTEDHQLKQILDESPDDAAAVLGKMLVWISSSESLPILEKLSELEKDRLPAVTALLGLSTLKTALNEWESNKSNPSERYWQEVLSKYSFVLGQLFAHPVVVIMEQAYLGGKAIDNTGGSYVDFLLGTASTNGLALLEIKTPETRLLGSEVRNGAYPFSSDVAGAVAQVLNYRHALTKEFRSIAHDLESNSYVLGGAPCFVLAGNASRELDSVKKRQAFESNRNELSSVRLVTFDELFSKLRILIDLLESRNNIV